MQSVPRANFHLGRITNKYLILEVIFYPFYRKKGLAYLFKGSRKLRQLVIENYQAARYISLDALQHIPKLPQTVTKVDFEDGYDPVTMVYLNEDRLYTEVDTILRVYLLKDLTTPIATYPLKGHSETCLVTGNRLYLGAADKLHVFEVSKSLAQPLEEVSQITLHDNLYKISRMDRELVLGINLGLLYSFDIETCKISQITHFQEIIRFVYDFIVLDTTNFFCLPLLLTLQTSLSSPINYKKLVKKAG
jgi:hypothetical protein